MPAPAMIGEFEERGVVYDCIDELARNSGSRRPTWDRAGQGNDVGIRRRIDGQPRERATAPVSVL